PGCCRPPQNGGQLFADKVGGGEANGAGAGRRPPRRGCVSVSLQPAIEPSEDGFVPEEAVAGVQDPMVLVGQVEEAARDAPPLERREGRDALSIWNAMIEAAMDHQHRGFPRGDVMD